MCASQGTCRGLRQARRQWEVAVVGEVPERAKELGNEKKSCLVGGSMKIQEVARQVCSGCCGSENSDVGTQQCLECCGERRRGCSKISGTRRWESLVFDETVPPWRGLELEDMEAVEALTAR